VIGGPGADLRDGGESSLDYANRDPMYPLISIELFF
jgi:hypothetical protein